MGRRLQGERRGRAGAGEEASGRRMMPALQYGLKMRNGDPGLQKVSLGKCPWCLGRQERYPALTSPSPLYIHTYLCDAIISPVSLMRKLKPRDVK